VVEVGDEQFEGELRVEQIGGPLRRARIVIDSHGLTIDDATFIGRSRFIGAAFESADAYGQCRVLFVASPVSNILPSHFRFIVSERDVALRMVRAIRPNSEHEPLQISFTGQGTWVTRTVFALLVLPMLAATGAVLGVIRFHPNLVLPVAVAYGLACVSLTFLFIWSERVRIVVGTDGVLRRRPVGLTRFVPFSRIRGATSWGTMLDVERTDAPPWHLLSALASSSRAPAHALSELIAMRIRQLMAHHAELGVKDPTAGETDRREMPIAEWIVELRAKPEAVQAYRVASAERNHGDVLADGSIDIVSRACSAFALKMKEGDAAIPRLRVAADSSASPKLRVALEKIAAGAPDEEIARRIEKLR
jgi:hypothetical protein